MIKEDSNKIHGVIYILLNKINGKIYLGQTIHERARYIKHRSFDKIDSKPKLYIDRAIKKYGFSNFDYGVLADVYDPDRKVVENELNYLEKLYIEYFNTTNNKIGYNVTKGGEGINGFKLSKKTKEKISKIKLGKKASEIAKKHLKEAKRKIYIKVAMYNRDGKFIRTFESTTEATRVTGIHNGNISNCINGKRPTAGGYIFKKAA